MVPHHTRCQLEKLSRNASYRRCCPYPHKTLLLYCSRAPGGVQTGKLRGLQSDSTEGTCAARLETQPSFRWRPGSDGSMEGLRHGFACRPPLLGSSRCPSSGLKLPLACPICILAPFCPHPHGKDTAAHASRRSHWLALFAHRILP